MQKISKWEVSFPELLAYQYNDKGHGMAWCEYCLRYHTHGNTSGHKGAHCDQVSPYIATGYILVDMGKAPEWMLKDYLRNSPYGKPEKSTGMYEHCLPTLTRKKTDPILNKSRKLLQPLRREAVYKMWLPYGKWICRNGREMLFNFYNEPMWERDADGKAKLANPHAQPEDIIDVTYFYDTIKLPHKSKKVLSECMYEFSKFGISSNGCRIPYNFLN